MLARSRFAAIAIDTASGRPTPTAPAPIILRRELRRTIILLVAFGVLLLARFG
jgi:hypothetical protein